MTEDQIKHMIDRFLGWQLPEDFSPDAGISFDPEFNKEYMAKQGKPPMRHNPTGTNLFDATQAESMVRYMLEGIPAALSAGEGGAPGATDAMLEAGVKFLRQWEKDAGFLGPGKNLAARFYEAMTAAAPSAPAPQPPGEEGLRAELDEIEAAHEELRRSNDGSMSGDFLATFAREDRLIKLMRRLSPCADLLAAAKAIRDDLESRAELSSDGATVDVSHSVWLRFTKAIRNAEGEG